ncbi:MAG: hypothetical protein ACP5OA_07705 [Candidatus Woesearchaeota archaeon]
MENKVITEDFRTVDAAGNAIIITRNLVNQQLTAYYHGPNSVTHYHMIELERHEFEPGNLYMKNDKRHLSINQIETKHKCTCGYDLTPLEKRLINPSIIACRCSQCRAEIFVEIPYKKNVK